MYANTVACPKCCAVGQVAVVQPSWKQKAIQKVQVPYTHIPATGTRRSPRSRTSCNAGPLPAVIKHAAACGQLCSQCKCAIACTDAPMPPSPSHLVTSRSDCAPCSRQALPPPLHSTEEAVAITKYDQSYSSRISDPCTPSVCMHLYYVCGGGLPMGHAGVACRRNKPSYKSSCFTRAPVTRRCGWAHASSMCKRACVCMRAYASVRDGWLHAVCLSVRPGTCIA